jgi:23S rRNA G2445 N2-methylase RlmL
MKLFAVCTPGLEPFTSREIEQLGLPLRHPVKGSDNEIGGVEKTNQVQRNEIQSETGARLILPINLA